MQAGILEKPDGDTDLSRHIFADHHLTEEQRQAMMRIYLSFRHENDDQAGATRVPAPSRRPPAAGRRPGRGRCTAGQSSLVGAVRRPSAG